MLVPVGTGFYRLLEGGYHFALTCHKPCSPFPAADHLEYKNGEHMYAFILRVVTLLPEIKFSNFHQLLLIFQEVFCEKFLYRQR